MSPKPTRRSAWRRPNSWISNVRMASPICPVTYIELAPVFNGDQTAQNEFLFDLGVTWPEAWTQADTEEAHRAWQRYVAARRATKAPKRPPADILIGAFASRFDGILTRNEGDFRQVFP